ncbi:MAG: hypothetical protein COU27_01685 [Candidatus Levybacteria bacterium CG10_big_fil_rev_8_21_14_0_10_36_7]|nr:MAG: hypothetical protein COU27_01685 [Candidatus Levybacteria bacterium CG10_big_fil_rev_8_21_14_0_10_36_7]
MTKNYTNPCTRCGKERIDGKKWKENLETFAGISVITHVDTVCPDKNCQKMLEEELARQKEKKEAQAIERKKGKKLN